MHPNRTFQESDPAEGIALLEATGFGMVFLTVPDGPRVAHAALVPHGEDHVRFHIARANALAPHLPGATALIVVNGPDGYISPRWYTEPGQVPTWDYVAVELEGPVRTLDEDELIAQIDELARRNEAPIAGAPWTRSQVDEASFCQMLSAIIGFELRVAARRMTVKLSQNKSAVDRERVAAGLSAQRQTALAEAVRKGVR